MGTGEEIEPTAAHPAADAPDWRTQKEEILCPMCEYNLCGLTEPRCPECGYRFVWRELLDARARLHPYLFEHHSEANFKSFWKTAWHSNNPWQFWSALHAGQRSRGGRLALYGLFCTLILMAGFLVLSLPEVIKLGTYNRQMRASVLAQLAAGNPPPAFRALILKRLDRDYPQAPRIEFFVAVLNAYPWLAVAGTFFLASLAWPWLTLGTLMIFRQSMGRANVKSIHVWRCVVYSSSVGVWVGVVQSIAGTMRILSGSPGGSNYYGGWSSADEGTVWTFTLIYALLFFAFALSLATAYRLYLRFDHSRAAVLASQFIVFLLLVVAVFNVPNPLFSTYQHILVKLFF